MWQTQYTADSQLAPELIWEPTSRGPSPARGSARTTRRPSRR